MVKYVSMFYGENYYIYILKWTYKLGHAIIENVSLYFNDKLIDEHTGEYLELWSQLYLKKNKYISYRNLIGHNSQSYTDQIGPINEQLLYIPLRFWFCQDIGLSLPLVAMKGTNIKIKVPL